MAKSLSIKRSASLCAALFFTCSPSISFAQGEKKEDIRAIVQQWVDTMSAIQKEENEWSRDKDVLQSYRDGLKSEISELKSQIADARTRLDKVSTEDASKIEEKESYETVAEVLSERVIELEEQFRPLLPIVPDPMKENQKFTSALAAFEKTLETADRKEMKGVPGRLQTVLILMSELEKFQNTITVRKTVKKASDGKEYEMDVIYLGLASAYAVNETASFSLIGKPEANGWVFTEDNSVATQVRLLVDATTGDGETQFVNIPLTIQ